MFRGLGKWDESNAFGGNFDPQLVASFKTFLELQKQGFKPIDDKKGE